MLTHVTAPSCNDYDYFATVFALTSRLEELHLHFLQWHETHWLHHELKQAHLWSRLRKISVKASRLYFANILPVLAFPSLRTLEFTVESPSN